MITVYKKILFILNLKKAPSRCFLFFIFLFSFSDSVLSQENCKAFKKGYFYFEANENEHYLIRRKKKTQHEYFLQTGERSVSRIQWISDCVYELKYISHEKSDSIRLKNVPILVRVNKIHPKEYSFIVSGFDELIQLQGMVQRITRRRYKKIKLIY